MKDPTAIVVGDLRALLFWATVGVRAMTGGTYENDICEIIRSYSKTIGYQGEKPKFGADRK